MSTYYPGRQGVWLVIEVPSGAAERAPELRRAMEDFARDWIAEATKTKRCSPGYECSTGIVPEAHKLRMFVDVR